MSILCSGLCNDFRNSFLLDFHTNDSSPFFLAILVSNFATCWNPAPSPKISIYLVPTSAGLTIIEYCNPQPQVALSSSAAFCIFLIYPHTIWNTESFTCLLSVFLPQVNSIKTFFFSFLFSAVSEYLEKLYYIVERNTYLLNKWMSVWWEKGGKLAVLLIV